jgi:hypothetical protein
MGKAKPPLVDRLKLQDYWVLIGICIVVLVVVMGPGW